MNESTLTLLPFPFVGLTAVESKAKGVIKLVADSPHNDRCPHSRRLTVSEANNRIGVVNRGFFGNVQKTVSANRTDEIVLTQITPTLAT